MSLNLFFGLCLFVGLFSLSSCTGTTDSLCSIGNQPNVTINGNASFDRVALSNTGALNFNSITSEPVKMAVVEAVCGQVIATTSTDDNGNYNLSIPGNTNGVYIRVKAQSIKTGSPSWDVAVSDETQTEELIFSMRGADFNSGNSDSTRNLHAASGWNGSEYSSERVAAPFAILDTIYDSMQLVLGVAPNTQFPGLDVKWSATSTNGTFYSNNTISVLGRESDTDEFDEHVISHEWGHYFQDAFSRDESIGGEHSNGDTLDIRVAFSEGFGNAFSAMVTGDPVYKDSQNIVFGSGFTINIESNSCVVRGWFSECTVQSVLYDFFDSTNETNDVFSQGFAELHQILTADMLNTDGLSSLFTFINPFKNLSTVNGASVDALLITHQVDSITDDFGSTMSTANPGVTNQFPIYDTSFPAMATLCTTGENGGYNGLGVTRFMQFTVPVNATYRFDAVRSSGLSSTDPDMYLREQGRLIGIGESTTDNVESFTANLTTGKTYVLELMEFKVYGQSSYNPSAAGAINETCFNITRTQI